MLRAIGCQSSRTKKMGVRVARLSDRWLDEWSAFADLLATESRTLLAPGMGLRPTVEVKPDRSLVTELDRRLETRLRELIVARYPHHGILGEEDEPARLDADLVWILDPIDGTAAFIAGVPVYGTLIALAHEGVPVIGIIDQPATGDRWIGVAGRPTTHSGRPCATRPCPALSEAIVSASNPDFFSESERPALDALRARTRWRIYGGCCMSYGLLASGRTDLAIDTKLQVYDYAPFRPIIEGAGGCITDWQGAPLTLASGPQVLAAGDRARHGEALAEVARALGG